MGGGSMSTLFRCLQTGVALLGHIHLHTHIPNQYSFLEGVDSRIDRPSCDAFEQTVPFSGLKSAGFIKGRGDLNTKLIEIKK